jgi:hypothetical protein
MKRALLFLITLILSAVLLPKIALALAPDEYALQVLQKDLPQTVRWFGQIGQASSLTQAEVYSLYQSALPETQKNQQQGISVKGSLERMLLLLEGARYFEQVQKAPLEFQNKKEISLRVLQAAKDQLDRTQFGEDPQVLLEEWVALGAGMGDSAKFTATLIEVFTELQKLLAQPAKVSPEPAAVVKAETPVDSQATTEVVRSDEETAEGAAQTEKDELAKDENFEQQRFSSYMESLAPAKIAEECRSAILWKTDRAESCQKDDTVECDRNYARQCKKLQ